MANLQTIREHLENGITTFDISGVVILLPGDTIYTDNGNFQLVESCFLNDAHSESRLYFREL